MTLISRLRGLIPISTFEAYMRFRVWLADILFWLYDRVDPGFRCHGCDCSSTVAIPVHACPVCDERYTGSTPRFARAYSEAHPPDKERF